MGNRLGTKLGDGGDLEVVGFFLMVIFNFELLLCEK